MNETNNNNMPITDMTVIKANASQQVSTHYDTKAINHLNTAIRNSQKGITKNTFMMDLNNKIK